MIPGFDDLTYFEVLDIPLGADSKEVQEAYYRVRGAFSKNALASYSLYGPEEREIILKIIEESYRTLIDEKTRQEYEEKLYREQHRLVREKKALQEPLPLVPGRAEGTEAQMGPPAEPITGEPGPGPEQAARPEESPPPGPPPETAPEPPAPRAAAQTEEITGPGPQSPAPPENPPATAAEPPPPASPPSSPEPAPAGPAPRAGTTAADEKSGSAGVPVPAPAAPRPEPPPQPESAPEPPKPAQPPAPPPVKEPEKTPLRAPIKPPPAPFIPRVPLSSGPIRTAGVPAGDPGHKIEAPPKPAPGSRPQRPAEPIRKPALRPAAPRDEQTIPPRGHERFEETVYDLPAPPKSHTPLDYIAAGTSGEFLRETREKRGLTIDRAFEATRIRKTILEAIEAENYKALPADVFLRGMLLIYARFLGLENPEAAAKGYMDRLTASRDWMD